MTPTTAPPTGSTLGSPIAPAAGRRPVVISVAVMTHPERLGHARALAAALPRWPAAVAVDPHPDGPPTTLRAARAAWAAMPADATHHLVLQDDVALCRDFAARLDAAVAAHPDRPLALYANWNAWNGAATRAAALAGAGWAPAVPGEWTPSLALLLPRADVLALLAAVPADSAETAPDDVVLQRELASRGRRVLISVPHLVEHLGDRSLVGNDTHGPRHSACFADHAEPAGAGTAASPPASARPPAWQPWESSPYPAALLVHLHRGEAHAVLPHPDGPRHLPVREYLRGTGLAHDAAGRREQAGRLPGQPVEYPSLRTELWYAGYLLGVSAPPDGPTADDPLVRAGLRTLALGGTNSLGPVHRWAVRHADRLTDLVADGVEAGRTRRRRHGPPAALDPSGPIPAPAERIWLRRPDAEDLT
ncbi:hypothetical protein [Kitasatospora sp. NPDC088783]|uniref:hypothetical protein n=1 Tax=Kitasatospora sp. NPDC088783 TaxID=3364077 RepID=UPI00382A7E2E